MWFLPVDQGIVLGATLVMGTVQLVCPAPPASLPLTRGGLFLGVSSTDPAAQPVNDSGIPIPSVYVRSGERTATFTIKTYPVPARATASIRVTDGHLSLARTLRIEPGSLDLAIRKLEITQAIQYLDTPGVADNSLPLFQNRPTAVRVYLQSNLDTNSTIQIPNIPVHPAQSGAGHSHVDQSPATLAHGHLETERLLAGTAGVAPH